MPLGSALKTKIDIDFTRAQGANSSGRIYFQPPRVKVGTTLLSTDRVLAEVKNGVGSIELVRLPSGTYRVFEEIDGRQRTFNIALPLDAPDVLDYENIAEVSAVPATYTVVRTVNGIPPNPTTGNVVVPTGGGGAVASVNGKTGVVVLDAEDVGALTQNQGDARYQPLGIAANPILGKTFCPEDYGDPVGDGVADDYVAVKAAWDAMWTWLKQFPKKQNYANFYIPPDKHYRVDSSIGSRLLTTDTARAILPIPMIPRTGWTKKTVRIVGGGEPYIVRAAELGGTPEQVDPGSLLFFDSGATTHIWSSSLGLPCAIGATDADMTDFEGNTFSNVHITLQDIAIRQNDNPSLCAVNLEQVSTCRLERVRFDVESVLDLAPLCTNKTGAAFLPPRSNNNVAVSMDKCIFEGHYTGIPLVEHGSVGDMIALRCTIGIVNRRPNSHHGYMKMLKVEQCPYGLAGYDPSDEGVRTAYGWSGEIAFLDFEDYAYNGEFPEIYAPIYPGTHFWDENNVITALIKMDRINSEPEAPAGVGVAPFNETNSAYVRGSANKLALWNRKQETAVTRLDNDPTPPVSPISFFGGQTGPGVVFENGGNPICLSMEWRITGAATLKGLAYWRVDGTMPANATGKVYKVSDQSEVANSSITFAAGSATGRIEAFYPTPLPLDIEEEYLVQIRMPNGNYTATTSYWDSGAGATGRTVGVLRAENNNDVTPPTPGQGSFREGAHGFANGNGNGANYWVDVIVQPSA
jgi:hypothetical protein